MANLLCANDGTKFFRARLCSIPGGAALDAHDIGAAVTTDGEIVWFAWGDSFRAPDIYFNYIGFVAAGEAFFSRILPPDAEAFWLKYCRTVPQFKNRLKALEKLQKQVRAANAQKMGG